jgi:DNA-binding transcriptional regulator YiaG
MKRKPMSSKEFRAALAALNLNQLDAAEFLGIGQRTSRAWAAARTVPSGRPIPHHVALLLRLMVAEQLCPDDVAAVERVPLIPED